MNTRTQSDMPDVPEMDFVDALCELWSGLNCAAYHLAYVRVYLQTAALQTDGDELRKQEQDVRDKVQTDTTICRAHLAAFFWQLEHFFEGLRIAVRRGKKEQPLENYFPAYEKNLETLEENLVRREIRAYRNKAHNIPAIIGRKWEQKGGRFLHHFLPSMTGHEPKDSIDMNAQLQHYFEFVATVWHSFAPSELKDKFPRSFKFPVTVPHTFLAELPPELKEVRQLEVEITEDKKGDKDGPGKEKN
jgi:hypothetical protein